MLTHLSQIDTMYLSNVRPWKSQKWVAPPPEEIARIRAEAGTHEAALAEEGAAIQNGGNGTLDIPRSEAEEKESRASGESPQPERQE